MARRDRWLVRSPQELVREWYEQTAGEVPRRRRGGSVRSAAAGLAVVAAVALPAGAAATTHGNAVPQGRFGSGRVVGQVRGDGFRSLPRLLAGTHPGKKVHRSRINGDGITTQATGSQGLIDNAGLKYFINTNITFSTTSSASGAMSEASFTQAVQASTLNGGTTASTLNDAFDGYNTVGFSLNNTVANLETGNANFVIYNKRGPATTECLGAVSGVNRQVDFPVLTSGSLQLSRKVYVPDNDSYARWLNIVTNTGGSPQPVTLVVANNLGSDSNTTVVTTSDGNATVTGNDLWANSFQNWSGTTSSDVRLAHVFQGASPTVPLAGINFVDGDDNPYWGYTFTVNPGQTRIIANYVVGGATNAGVQAKAAAIAANAPTACMSTAEVAELANFGDTTPPIITFDHQSPPPDKKGWNSTDVKVFWDCTDPGGSGVVAPVVSKTETGEGKGLKVKGTCVDLAGNKSHDIHKVNIDRTGNLPPLAVGLHAESALYHAVLDQMAAITVDVRSGNTGQACADFEALRSFVLAHADRLSPDGVSALIKAINTHESQLGC